MGIHDGHRSRMKQEFLQGGLTHFSEPRALELLLFYSRMQGDVNPTAHALLDTFGSLAGVLDAD
ncbi:MAG: DNA repair protein RadC, partial [Evtepia sp.]